MRSQHLHWPTALICASALLTVLLGGFGQAQESSERFTVPGLNIPETLSPVRLDSVSAEDGNLMEIALRFPPGDGPFPAVIIIHGGMKYRDINARVAQAKSGPLQTRLLAAGYVIVQSSFRNYSARSRDPGPILDNISVVDYVKALPEVDEESVVVLGHSGGGRLALELAGFGSRTGLAAIVPFEPATTLFAEMYPEGVSGPDGKVMSPEYFTDVCREILQRKVRALSCPVLIVHSDRHRVNWVNNTYLVPEIRKQGKSLEMILYPGYGHGFVWGRQGITTEVFEKMMDDVNKFCKQHVRVKPAPVSP